MSRACFDSAMASEPFRRDSSGRYIVWPQPLAVAFGERVRRARTHVGFTQQRVADRAGVSQSAVSRLERGLATGMSLERLLRILDAIGPTFPMGTCPHDHTCAWNWS